MVDVLLTVACGGGLVGVHVLFGRLLHYADDGRQRMTATTRE